MLDTGVLASTSVCTLAGDVHSLPPPFGYRRSAQTRKQLRNTPLQIELALTCKRSNYVDLYLTLHELSAVGVVEECLQSSYKGGIKFFEPRSIDQANTDHV